eukprot:gb/GECG01016843.1/.p1 GENE.gb/GECG01016843.1/~~gb/GECG01016843.1/.p1  ORF type:complete len:727 (+),score=69.66 gb/GECG01016843.1/:1-2181(+)
MAEALVNRRKDVKADHVYTDIKGQLTNEKHPGIFDIEILPDEKILKEFRTYAIREPRTTFFIACMCCCTAGLYLCYLYGLASCRRFSVGNKKIRLAFTSKGRILMWGSNVEGGMTGANVASTKFMSRTEVSAFHIQKINMMQAYAGRYPKGPCGLLGEHHDARLRIFFGSSYPQASVMTECGAHMDSHVLFGLHQPEWDRASYLSGRGIGSEEEQHSKRNPMVALCSKLAYFVVGLFHWSTCGCFYKPNILPRELGGRGNMVLDVSTVNDEMWKDGYHEDFQSAWEELSRIQEFILMAKEGPEPLKSVQPITSHFSVKEGGTIDEARESELEKDTKINIHTKKIPLGEEEGVVDALPILPRMTWYECLCVPWICCRRKFAMQSALISTTQRMISASEYRHATGDDYEFFMNSFFLTNMKGGYLISDPDGIGYTMDVKTEYGALRIEPVMSRMWPWTDKVDKFIRTRMFEFLKHLETASASEAVIPAPMEGTIPNEDDVNHAKSTVNLWEDEAVCSALRSKDLYNMDGFWNSIFWRFLGCNDITCTRQMVQTCSCGGRPFRLDQVLVLTTHRVISYQSVRNECCISACKAEPELLLWFPLGDVEGLRTIGTMSRRPQNFVTYLLGKILPCCNAESAAISVQFGVNSQFNTIPLNVGQIDSRASSGRMEGHQEFYHFRAAFAFYHSHEKPSGAIQKVEPDIPAIYNEAPLPDNVKEETPENPVQVSHE